MAETMIDWTVAEILAVASAGNHWMQEVVDFYECCRNNGRESEVANDAYNNLTSSQCEFAEVLLAESVK